jgi:hypothetical protein
MIRFALWITSRSCGLYWQYNNLRMWITGRACTKRMRWFRSNMRLGSWCGLLALAIQLTLSFAHIHVVGRSPHAGTPRVAMPLPAALPDLPQTLAKSQAPANPTPAGPASADFCPICTLINLAGSVWPAAPPSLVLPILAASRPLPVTSEGTETFFLVHSFQARAPPSA